MRHRTVTKAVKIIVGAGILLAFEARIPPMRAADEQAKTETVSVPEGNTLEVTVPKDWKYTKLDQGKILPPTLKFESADGKTLLQLTLLADSSGQFGKKEQIEKGVTAAAQQYVDGSVEKKVTLAKLDSKNGIGSYAQFTDASLVAKSPQPGQYLVVATGTMVYDKTIAAFTLLSDSFDSKSYAAALELLKSGVVVKGK